MLSGHHGATRTCAHRPLKARSLWYRQSQPGASTRLSRRAKCLRCDQPSSLRFWQFCLQWWAARPPKNALRAPSIAVTIPSGLQVTRAKRGPGTAVTGDALPMSRYKRAFSSFVRAAHCHARSATSRETRRVSDASKRVQNRAPVRKDLDRLPISVFQGRHVAKAWRRAAARFGSRWGFSRADCAVPASRQGVAVFC